MCATECGDGITAGDESCDDGNVDHRDGCTDTCEIQAIPLAEWVQVASLPPNFNATHHSFAFSFDGLGYIVTGSSPTGVRDDFYRYDPDEDTWTELEPFPGPARSFAIEEPGWNVLWSAVLSQAFLNDFWVFDPRDLSWTELARCPCAARRHPATVVTKWKGICGNGEQFTGK